MESIINFVTGIICILFYIFSKIFNWQDWFVLCSFIPLVVIPVAVNSKNLYFGLQLLVRLNKDIRISMSYVYRICVDNEYLLVQNSHRKNSYQFVGGKYKYFEQAEMTLKSFGMNSDDKLKQTENRKNDIAFYIPANKLTKFIKWFDDCINRDIDCAREFREELLTAKKSGEPLLDAALFSDMRFRKVCIVRTPITKSPVESGWNCLEYKQYDVLEPVFSMEQAEALKKLKVEYNGDYVKWVKKADINSLGYREGTDEKEFSINEHTKWCLNEKYSKY